MGSAASRISQVATGVLALTAAGVGVAIVPTATENITLPDITYRPLRDMTTGPNVVTISRPDELSGPVGAFLQLIRTNRDCVV